MKQTFFVLSGILFLAGTAAYGQPNIVAFYPYVDSLIQFPPPQESLSVACQRKVGPLYVTLLRLNGYSNTWVAAVTQKPEKNLAKKISLSVQFENAHPSTARSRRGDTSSTATATGRSITWPCSAGPRRSSGTISNRISRIAGNR